MEDERFLDPERDKNIQVIVFREASNNSGEGNNQPGYNKMTGATTIEELRKAGLTLFQSSQERFSCFKKSLQKKK